MARHLEAKVRHDRVEPAEAIAVVNPTGIRARIAGLHWPGGTRIAFVEVEY